MIPYVRSLEIVGIKSRMHYFNNGALGGASIKRLKLLVNFSAKGTDISKLLKDMEVSDLLSGTADTKINLSGSGASVRLIMTRLNGKTDIIMNEGGGGE